MNVERLAIEVSFARRFRFCMHVFTHLYECVHAIDPSVRVVHTYEKPRCDHSMLFLCM